MTTTTLTLVALTTFLTLSGCTAPAVEEKRAASDEVAPAPAAEEKPAGAEDAKPSAEEEKPAASKEARETPSAVDGPAQEKEKEVERSTGFGLPFPAGAAYTITQGPFGGYSHVAPYNQHGIDFGMPVGANVVAAGAGTIRFEGWYGSEIKVVIDHGNNRCTTYAHLNATIVNVGQAVRRGQVIGQSGATGQVTGPHLHWGMVYCSDWKSREVVNTDELGTTYNAGTIARSTNRLQ